MKIFTFNFFRQFLTVLTCTIISLSSLNAYAATVRLFLNLDGIAGESTDQSHKDWIDINSFSWGATAVNGGKSTASPFSWTQQIDKSVPQMFTDLMSGKHIKTATLDVVSTGEQSHLFFQLQFDNIIMSKLNVIGDTSSQAVAGAFDGYNKITMSYWQQLPNGSYAPPVVGGWDIGANTAAYFGSPLAIEGLFLAQPSAVPLPAAFWLFGSGLIGLIGLSRRKTA